ncbi:MAG TPA: hypothetical protein DCE44_22215, partial [Verrucomicrobiales bacterium]|nr:hypothetical protein [Verrucomicrobiales bacterium]
MRLIRLPALLLSLFLQLAPFLRVASADTALALAPVMAILRLLAGATTVAGSFHAVSGATAPSVSSTKTKVGAVGVNLNYRILLSGGSPEAFEAVPLPPGLTLTVTPVRAGIASKAEITGRPTEIGETVTTITAWNNPDFSGATTSAEVTFLIMDLEPLAPTVKVGSPVTFRSIGRVSANSKVTYQWQFNDVDIPNETNASLSLPAVAETEAGQYRVRLAFGDTRQSTTSEFTQRATLTITPPSDPPIFTTTPTAARLHLGELLSLRAEATGEGELTFAWTKEDEAIPGETSASLQRASVALEDAGSYRVTVTGAGGSATSPPALVTVAGPLTIGAVSLGEGSFIIPFNGIAGRTYALESLTSLSDLQWQIVADLVPVDGEVFIVPNPEEAPRVFR